MPVYEMQDAPTPTNVPERSPSRASARGRSQSEHTTHVITQLQAELDGYFVDLRHLNELEPGDVLQQLSSMAARAGEIRSALIRSENSRANAFRTREIDPFLEQIKLQFTIHSRLIAVRQQDLDLVRGQT